MNIPLYVISFERLESLRRLVNWAKWVGQEVVILDMGSTYPPLLEWYEGCGVKVHKCGRGAAGIVVNGLQKEEGRGRFYALTDPDVIPMGYCPDDLVQHLLKGALREGVGRAGVALDITNIPNHYQHRSRAIMTEIGYWENRIDGEWFASNVDTTFAVWDSWAPQGIPIRSNYPYVAEHTTWHLDLANLPPDEKHYVERVNRSNGWHLGYRTPPSATWSAESRRRMEFLGVTEACECCK